MLQLSSAPANGAGRLIEASSPADPLQPYRAVGTALALCILFVSLSELLWNALDPSNRDFISFWAAAQLALAGTPAAAYDNGALHAVQSSAARFGSGEMPFAYPPAFLLLVMPFGLLSFPPAMAAWAASTFALYFAAARWMFPGSGLLAAAFPAVLVTAAIGQSAFLIAALFIAGLVMLPSRPFAAGLLLGCLVLKPQLGLLLPLALVASRQWRAIAGAAVSSAGLLLAGIALFGFAATAAWFAQMPLYAWIAREGLVGWHKLASLYAAARQLGLEPGAAFLVHGLVALAAAAATWRIWRSPAEPQCKAAALAAATMLASPYLFLYDALILVVPFFWLAQRGFPPPVIAGLWCLPLVTIAQAQGSSGLINLNPLVPAVLLLLVWSQFRRSQQGPAVAAPLAPIPAA